MKKLIFETVEFDLCDPQEVYKYYSELVAHHDWIKYISVCNEDKVRIKFIKEDSQND